MPRFVENDSDGRDKISHEFQVEIMFLSERDSMKLNFRGEILLEMRSYERVLMQSTKMRLKVNASRFAVYRNFVRKHRTMHFLFFPATLPGMWSRTFTIGSAGKSFGVTGWKIGWTICPKELIDTITCVHLMFCNSLSSPLQVRSTCNFRDADRNTSVSNPRWILFLHLIMYMYLGNLDPF